MLNDITKLNIFIYSLIDKIYDLLLLSIYEKENENESLNVYFHKTRA